MHVSEKVSDWKDRLLMTFWSPIKVSIIRNATGKKLHISVILKFCHGWRHQSLCPIV